MEGALNALSSAMPEDRGIRLKEVMETKVHSDQLRTLKTRCIDSYNAFLESEKLLKDARTKTQTAELLMAKLRATKDAGARHIAFKKSKLTQKSQSAASSLSAVNQSLNKAEELAKVCQEGKEATRKRLFGP